MGASADQARLATSNPPGFAVIMYEYLGFIGRRMGMRTLTFAAICAAKRRQIRRFFKQDEEGGTTTIEFILWLPIFIVILALIIDVCFLFLCQAIMYDVASDAARRLAIGSLDKGEAKTFAETESTFQGIAGSATISDTTDTGDGTVTVLLTHRIEDADVFGILALVSGAKISASVTQMAE